ncbi:hypothetical protein EJB05_16763 [Eragrostis curvula]|uniref:SOSEKI DIX-like domain-containing protein n=1 Tax=Eragrostis curvula TaxID=38414 RepID=A0A5J9VHD0_9POAL|nr:hypothetical protein EJB05_16763 [Eragrostis curvula]
MDKGAAGGGAGEVRRINVVYFLSRGGRSDHPHLFRVNQHYSRAGGVRLRDVKRWLSEIRGKDMPDNFSWSYKRKYKGGYVWQDLKDDDLITPISDNEYVLKGCDVRGTPPHCVQAPKTTTPSSPLDEKTRDDKDWKTTCSDRADRPVEVVLTPDSDESSPKPPPPADDQDSPGSSGESAARRSTVLFKLEVSHSQDLQGQNHHHHKQQQQQQEQRKEEPEVKAVVARAVARPAPEAEQLQGAVRGHAVAGGNKARTMRVARKLHSIMTCGTADADDAAIRPVARRQQRSAAEAGGNDDGLPLPQTPTCPGIGMDGCGLRVSRKARLRKGGKEKQGKRDGGKRDGPGGDAHKPAALPRCSQCGKEFKPQELHSHMQSCRGLKERMKSSSNGAWVSVDRSRDFAARAGDHRSKPGRCTPERPSPVSAVFLLTES